MTQFLASIRDAEEARIALQGGADIIDAKEPAHGALGAVALPQLSAIIAEIEGRCRVSATIGDDRITPRAISQGVAERAGAGADYVKFGVFDAQAAFDCATAAASAAAHSHALAIAVLFADLSSFAALTGERALAAFKSAGLAGVMVDTACKTSGPLTRHIGRAKIGALIRNAHHAGLKCGLAGSLGLRDIDIMVALRPDFLGFRGALCAGGRSGDIDAGAVAQVRAAIPLGPASLRPDVKQRGLGALC